MTSPTVVFEDPTKERGTHALVVGVGHYPHLMGGGAQQYLPFQGLRQLSAAPLSARRIATWLLTSFHHPEMPLRSVSLLLSEREPMPFVWTEDAEGRRLVVPNGAPAARSPQDPRPDDAIAVADYATLQEAAKHWFVRGHEHEGNQLLFFFSGHGLGAASDVGLLLRDFGGDPTGGLSGMLDLRVLRLGMRRCAARKQVWFVDACRTPSSTIAGAEGYLGESPIKPGMVLSGSPCISPLFHSTIQGHKAYGRPGDVTLFTEALLGALEGGGSLDLQGDGVWHVTPGVLHQSLAVPLKHAAREHGELQIPATDSLTEDFSIHVLRGAPRVPVYILCSPEEATNVANLRCASVLDGRVETRQPMPGAWRIALSQGRYSFEATFATGVPWKSISKHVDIRPPTREYSLGVSHG